VSDDHIHKLYTRTTAAAATATTYECVFSLVLNNEGRLQVDRTIKSPGVDESRVVVLCCTASPPLVRLLFLHRFGKTPPQQQQQQQSERQVEPQHSSQEKNPKRTTMIKIINS
jgi:hypothetical protein